MEDRSTLGKINGYRESSCKVQSPVRLLSEDALVEELINKHNDLWNLDLLQAMFNEDGISYIVKLPVSLSYSSDKLV